MHGTSTSTGSLHPGARARSMGAWREGRSPLRECPWGEGEAQEGHGEVQNSHPCCSSPCTLCPQERQTPPAASTSLWPAAPHYR